jgi:hypothetical protein
MDTLLPRSLLKALQSLLDATDCLIEMEALCPEDGTSCCFPSPLLESLIDRCWGHVARAIITIHPPLASADLDAPDQDPTAALRIDRPIEDIDV